MPRDTTSPVDFLYTLLSSALVQADVLEYDLVAARIQQAIDAFETVASGHHAESK